jgi:hypothetical protein
VPAGEGEPEHLAASPRGQGVDAGTGRVGDEELPLAHALGRIGGGDDIAPGVGADDDVDEVDDDCDCGGSSVRGLHLGEDILAEIENPGQLQRR